jgi:glycine cleavage system H protein
MQLANSIEWRIIQLSHGLQVEIWKDLGMPAYLEATVDKFVFKVATDRYFSAAGVWALAAGNLVQVGLSDYLQQRSGDVAFVDVKRVGTVLQVEDEFASIETIKVNIALPCPAAGKIVRVNPLMESAPEKINQDPYGDGWLCEIEASDWAADRAALMDAPAYFTKMKGDAEEEAKKP